MEQIQPIEPAEQIPVWDYTIRIGPFGDLSGSQDQPAPPLPEPLELRLRVTYRERQDSWYLDIFAPVADVIPGLDVELDRDRPIMTGFRLTSSIVNAMFDYKIPELPNQQFFFVLDIDGTGSDPGFEALGRSHALIHSDAYSFIVTAAELAAELGLLDQIDLDNNLDKPSAVVILP